MPQILYLNPCKLGQTPRRGDVGARDTKNGAISTCFWKGGQRCHASQLTETWAEFRWVRGGGCRLKNIWLAGGKSPMTSRIKSPKNVKGNVYLHSGGVEMNTAEQILKLTACGSRRDAGHHERRKGNKLSPASPYAGRRKSMRPPKNGRCARQCPRLGKVRLNTNKPTAEGTTPSFGEDGTQQRAVHSRRAKKRFEKGRMTSGRREHHRAGKDRARIGGHACGTVPAKKKIKSRFRCTKTPPSQGKAWMVCPTQPISTACWGELPRQW